MAQRAQPVVDHADADAVAGARDERVREALADLVVVDDVTLEVHALAGVRDGGEPGRVVLGPVLQDADGVALHEGRARGPREGLVGDHAHGGESARRVRQRPRPRGRVPPVRGRGHRHGPSAFATWPRSVSAVSRAAGVGAASASCRIS